MESTQATPEENINRSFQLIVDKVQDITANKKQDLKTLKYLIEIAEDIGKLQDVVNDYFKKE